MKIIHQAANLDEVMRYFAKDYNVGDGRTLYELEYFISPDGKTVMFKMWIDEAPSSPTPPDSPTEIKL